MSAEELTEKFHPTRDWCNSSVRCLAWHPHTNKVAVVMRDDGVHVYSAPSKEPYFDRTAPPFVPVLKYKTLFIIIQTQRVEVHSLSFSITPGTNSREE